MSRRHLAVPISVTAVVLLLTGCTGPSTIPAPTVTTTTTVTATPTTPAPTTTAAAKTVPVEPGECPFDPAGGGAVAFTILADDDTTPITLTWSSFRPEGEPVIRTATVVGPVISILQSDCGSGIASHPWTFTATSATGGGLSCVTSYGGKIISTKSDFSEGDIARGDSVDCSGHPGM